MRRVLFVLLALGLARGAAAQSPPVQADLSTTACPGAGCVRAGVGGYATTGVEISGTFSGTIQFKTGIQNLQLVGCTKSAAGSAPANTTTTTGFYTCGIGAASILEVSFQSYVSGSAHVVVQSIQQGGASGGGGGGGGSAVTQGTTPWIMAGQDTAGSPTAGTVVPIQGVGGGTAVPISNGDITAISTVDGTTTDAKACGDVNGSLSAKLRCISYILNTVFDSGNSRLNTANQNGSTTATIGGVASVAYTSSVAADPCQSNAPTYAIISQTTNTQLFAGTSSKKTYVCSLMVVAADAENLSLVSGTGSVCGTNTAAMIGGTTAAAGTNLAANGGWVLGTGGFSVAISAVNADNVCLLQSGSGRVAGVIKYVAQ